LIPGLTNAARLALLQGKIKPTDKFKVALYTFQARLGRNSFAYTPDYEAVGLGYKAGGKELGAPIYGVVGDAAFMNWEKPVIWKASSITARGALIYDASLENLAILVIDFEKTITSTNHEFKLSFPANSDALIQLR
jgi:hypothetical protein